MTEEQIKKLRAYYHSLVGQQRIFDEAADRKAYNIERHPVIGLSEEISRLQTEFPQLIPPFRPEEFGKDYNMERYVVSGIRTYLAMAISRLKVAIDTQQSVPVTETREFTFVKDFTLRQILERDYLEIQRAYISKCWKSVIILCGSAIEAILTDLLIQNNHLIKTATKTPAKKPDISTWDLADLINVAVELNLVSAGVEKLSHSVRDYRNLVHPGNEIRNKLKFDAEEAKIAVEVLNIVYRDLSP